MISPMRKIAVYGVQASRKAVLEELQKCGWVEIKKTEHDNTGLDSPDAAAAISRFDNTLPHHRGLSKSLMNTSLKKQACLNSEKTYPLINIP